MCERAFRLNPKSTRLVLCKLPDPVFLYAAL